MDQPSTCSGKFALIDRWGSIVRHGLKAMRAGQ